MSAESVSFCLWCPEYADADTNATQPGKCMYNDDPTNINKNCRTNPDITSKCSLYGDCATCSDDVVCAWCPSMGRCVTAILDDMPFPLDEFKCKEGKTKVCCESYKDCGTCSQYSGTINA